jgi:poly-gamma-glutamate capsule biosynthesis protein CapA/YwtB (metallophosphatase superfamily)
MELVFLGDIMFGWRIGEKILKSGSSYPFMNMSKPFSTEGIVIGNLETVVSDASLKAIRLKNDKIISPVACLESLNEAGIFCVSVANNHINDYGREGLVDTLKNLKAHSIAYVGAGESRSEAEQIMSIRKREFSLGVIARTFTCESANASFSDTDPQAAELIRDRLMEQVKAEKAKHDLLTIVLHTGFEYCPYPDYQDVEFFRKLVDQGADIVIGHHPHIIQGVERYKQGLIAYSLGNFLFDNSDEEIPETSTGFMLHVQITKQNNKCSIESHSISPTYISENGQVHLAKDELKDKILQKVQDLSDPLKLDIYSYRKHSDSVNADIIIAVRKKEIIRKLKNFELLYLVKKVKNIKWMHIRMIFNRLKKFLFGHKLENE